MVQSLRVERSVAKQSLMFHRKMRLLRFARNDS